MTLSPVATARKMKAIAARVERDTKEDAFLLLQLVKQYEPTKARLKELSGLGTMQFNRAWAVMKSKVWTVGKNIEIRTETAKL